MGQLNLKLEGYFRERKKIYQYALAIIHQDLDENIFKKLGKHFTTLLCEWIR